jgi:superfamily II DNA or RNA helicase
MRKPDFKVLRTLLRAVEDTNKAFGDIYAEQEAQEQEVRRLCQKAAAQLGKEALDEYSVEELKNARAGIRVSALENAGYKTLGDLGRASNADIEAVEGIGEKQIETLRGIVAEFANSLASRATIRLSSDENGKATYNDELIVALARLINSDRVRAEGKETVEQFHGIADKLSSDRFVKNSVSWFFAVGDLKQHTLEVYDDVGAFCKSHFFEVALSIIDRYHIAANTSATVALEIFKRNGADFYAALERLGSSTGNKPFVYGSVPAQLAAEIDDLEPELSGFKGTLRSYQLFGCKYILHQKYVLLGDEMGLGKTIQAIAAMTHVSSTEEKSFFLVVCPASVIVNWAREIAKFSSIETHILHGHRLSEEFGRWQESGGAAITNYESIGKIVDDIDNHMKLSLLVIDEAHYIKNPDAKRTMYIRRLDNESSRILLMTGTPLENKVEEMCNLLEFVRPDLVEEFRSLAHLANLPEFKEKLSPVYLRRTRDQVLTELPPIDEQQEWCDLTDEDRTAYVDALSAESFTNMRRVSFLNDDMKTSAKMNRLLELCKEAGDEGRKVVIYSFFRETIAKVSEALGDMCQGVITGDTKVELRQSLVDSFSENEKCGALVCQIQAGGVGLNIQAASIVIFCEPQIKPSLTWQALSRVYRMGQVRNVLVYHLLCPGTVDEEMNRLLQGKELEFESFAAESAVAEAHDNLIDRKWVQEFLEKEREKYLPAVI